MKPSHKFRHELLDLDIWEEPDLPELLRQNLQLERPKTISCLYVVKNQFGDVIGLVVPEGAAVTINLEITTESKNVPDKRNI